MLEEQADPGRAIWPGLMGSEQSEEDALAIHAEKHGPVPVDRDGLFIRLVGARPNAN